uniref:Uncharacterized protein n=1 Tax=Arundo donax TaxID=35708 RepID=A0A0A9EKR6_ARUDO
MNSVDSATIFT